MSQLHLRTNNAGSEAATLDGFVAALRRELDVSAFYAERQLRPQARVVRDTPDRIWDAITKMLWTEARSEYLGLDNPWYLTAANVDEKILVRGSRTMKGLVDRGIPVRQVSTRAGLEADPDAFPALQWRNGGEARVIDQLPTKACIVDRRFALVPVDLKVLAHGLMIITDPVVVNILVATHQSLWQSGEDPRAHGSEPPPHLRAVLAMLASGLPDDRAAERAGLSPRTYSRRVNELMRLLGARSRFEAGIEAARRGWI